LAADRGSYWYEIAVGLPACLEHNVWTTIATIIVKTLLA
jgi:hypothetical protein